jgi:hypothetical protein
VNSSEERLVSESFSIWVYSYIYFVPSTLCTLEWTIFNYFFIMPNIGGFEIFFGRVDILFEGVIANIGGVAPPCPPPHKIRLWWQVYSSLLI